MANFTDHNHFIIFPIRGLLRLKKPTILSNSATDFIFVGFWIFQSNPNRLRLQIPSNIDRFGLVVLVGINIKITKKNLKNHQ